MVNLCIDVPIITKSHNDKYHGKSMGKEFAMGKANSHVHSHVFLTLIKGYIYIYQVALVSISIYSID